MKIVINGGTGLIGSKTVTRLRGAGHDVVAASPQSGINSVTGEGLAEAVKGAQVIVDLSNSPSWEDAAVLKFFQKSTGNLIAAAKANGVKHYIALSVVGTERLQASGYFVAKHGAGDTDQGVPVSPTPSSMRRSSSTCWASWSTLGRSAIKWLCPPP